MNISVSSVDSFDRKSRISMTAPSLLSPRSVSPISPSRSEGHCQEKLHSNFLTCMVHRNRMGRKTSHDSRLEYHPEDDSGCSTDSCSSAGVNSSGSNFSSILSNLASHDDSSSNNFEESLSSSWTEDNAKPPKDSQISVHFRSASSLRRALRNLSFSTRSLSCTAGDRDDTSGEDLDEDTYEKRVSFKTSPEKTLKQSTGQQKRSTLISQRSKTPPPQRRILRQPVSYLYLKGLSGLPTQRVPRSSVCCQGYR